MDMTLGRPIRDERLCATEHAYQLEQKLLDVHDFARKHLNISSESMKSSLVLFSKTQSRLQSKITEAMERAYDCG